MSTHKYYCDCTGWDTDDIDGLNEIIDERTEITRGSFLRKVDREDLKRVEESLGYADHPSRGLTMAGDWHVEYFRSVWHGQTVYGFRYSAIEYVFIPGASGKLPKADREERSECGTVSDLGSNWLPRNHLGIS